MKKLILLFAVLLTGLTSAKASEIIYDKHGEDLTITKRYRYTQPIMFVERGVEFLIFPDGTFDFNTEYGNSYQDDYYRRTNSRRSAVNVSFQTPGRMVNYSRPRLRGVRIIHDRYGNVRRIGNVFINYDYYGRVKRVGSVYLQYNRGRLVRVGNMRLQYNRQGRLIRTTGHVNHSNQGCGFCGSSSCSMDHYGQDDDWFDGHGNADDDFYYYRQEGKLKKSKKNKRIKRKKNDD